MTVVDKVINKIINFLVGLKEPFAQMQLFLLLSSFFFGGAQAGWTSYPPLSIITAPVAQSMWILSIVLVGTSSILGSVNFVVTILKMKAPSMRWDQLPLFCWAILATSMLALFSTPVLAAGLVLLLFDINFGTSFFKPDAGGNSAA